ncbi:helix-turn-helix domain-containing protein [Streptomyces phaeochromogenes]|uniref:helix-turn-helix domain-containing protein n=1 Tax=Streptomyces phaeochromogenes TaxID=1923 RepID=UPI0033C8DE76
MTSASRAVHRAGRRHTHLSTVLTGLKEDSGLTFHELAARTTVSASALKRAAGLHALAPEHVVTAFVRACGADTDQAQEALKLWRAARAEQRGILATLHAPAVTAIRTLADLTAALAAAYERAGAPALRVLQERAATDDTDGALLLPLTSAWRITRREGRPTTWTQCAAFLRGCGIHPRRLPAWQDAWTRAQPPTQTLTPIRRSSHAADPNIMWVDRKVHLNMATESNWIVSLSHEDRTGLPGEQRTLTRVFDSLAPAERHTVLSAGLTRLLTTRARRNGTAPDTIFDTTAVDDDGTLHLIQAKHYGDTTPPAPVPAALLQAQPA